jgi:hypothetical protein
MSKEDLVYRFVKIPISDKKMSKFLYALFMVKGEITTTHHLGLEKYTRKQNSGNMVNVVVKLEETKIETFEELAEVKLKTSEEFQGVMRIN